MNIVCLGGGPAGLYFGILMKMQDPPHRITVVERNKSYDTFGWGVVFSDQTMDNMRRWDPATAAQIEEAFNHWDDIELQFKGEVIRSGGHGFVGIGRKKLLNILQALGVELVFETEVTSDADFPDADLIIASDGVNSRIRTRHEAVFKPDIVVRPNRFIWLGTHKLHGAFTFLFEKTEQGWFAAHIYKFDPRTTTFIVECPEAVWLAHGLDKMSTDESIAFCEQVFAANLQGEKLLSNARHLRGSAWLNFQRIKCEHWPHFNGRSQVVLMGDAVRTARFAIGPGTKLATEDAIERARQSAEIGAAPARIPQVLERYLALRSIDVLRLQNAAWNAMEWFEVCGNRYCDPLEPPQFMYSMLTRSQRISHENLRLRDAGWLGGFERWFARRAGAELAAAAPPPMFTPYQVRGLRLKNRVVASPMAQYSAVDGVAGDYHLVHLGARALGGAGLVFAEMTCVSPEARITPDDAVQIARAFKAAGADLIDCSSGQVNKQQKPVYGRMYQTPFADRIRQEAGIATIAVGATSEADHVNSIIAAGRADLCAIGRPHLANPAWTLTEAAKIGHEARAARDDHAALKRWLRLLSCTTQIADQIRRRLRRRFGISLARFDYLAQRHRRPAGLSMTELSRCLMVTGANVTGLTDELAPEGLVLRESSPTDGRSWLVRLTPAGREGFEAMASEHEQWILEMFAGLGAKAMTQVYAQLGDLRVHLIQTANPETKT